METDFEYFMDSSTVGSAVGSPAWQKTRVWRRQAERGIKLVPRRRTHGETLGCGGRVRSQPVRALSPQPVRSDLIPQG